MKRCFVWVLAPALIFGAVSCNKKDDGGQSGKPDTPNEAPGTAGSGDPVTPPPAGGSLSAEQRAELVGFARHLPAETEYLVSLHNGSDATKRVMASKVWKTFAQMTGMPGGEVIEEDGEEIVEEAMGGPSALFGQEFTLAMGKGTSEQLQNLLVVNSRLNFFQMSALVQMLDAQLGEGEEGFLDADPFSEEFMLELLNDEKSGVGLFDKLNMPPMYIAFKTTDEDREMINQQVASGLEFFNFFEEVVEPVEIKRGKSVFKGYQLVGAKIAKELEAEKEDMEEFMSKETADRLIKAIAAKNLVVTCGIHGDYVLLFAGSSEDDLKLADDVNGSLAAGNALAFMDAYAKKDILAIAYGNGEGLKSVMSKAKGSFSDMSEGIRDGLANSDNLGDTRDLDATSIRSVSPRVMMHVIVLDVVFRRFCCVRCGIHLD